MSDLRTQLIEVRTTYGSLTPTHVVDAARPIDHPLHGRFEWDDTIAGEKYRLGQAGELIRSVQIVFRRRDGERARVREFHPVDRPAGIEYEPIAEVAGDPVARAVLLADMRRDWATFQRRYEHLEEFIDLLAAAAGQAGAA